MPQLLKENEVSYYLGEKHIYPRVEGGGGDDKEDVANKVTSLSSSSTDIQYPSAKCVYELVGDVETLLSSI